MLQQSTARARQPSHASIACPHCRARAAVRTSRQITVTYREMHLRCTNDDCGHVFVAELVAIRTISPSACPDAAVDLPLAPPRRKAQNDNGEPPPTAAND